MSRPTNIDHRRQVLATLLRARRPLSPTEIAEHLGIDGPSSNTVRAICNEFVAAGEARRMPGRWSKYERAGKERSGGPTP